MVVTKVGNRGVLFTFEELNKPPYNCKTNVYTVVGKGYYFICDTYLGDYYIKDIKGYLESFYGKKNYLIFNSHSHWDHIWGNLSFRNNLIVSHSKCRKLIKQNGEEQLALNCKDFAKEKINIVLPNVTFENRLVFEEEGIEFFFSPGHSEDSSSCYDRIDNTLFVGDNVDDPIPSFMDWHNLNLYIATLENYLGYNADFIVQSHGPVTNNQVIKQNISYLKSLINKEPLEFSSMEVQEKHLSNLNFLMK